MIKLGLAGVRAFAYIDGFLDMPDDVEITALCELNQDILDSKAKEYGIKNTYRIFEDMLDSDIDAVFIATPMHLHGQQALAALDAGKHVLSEVTAATDMEELFFLKETAEKSKGIYMLCENYIYRPDVIIVKNLIKEGKFGEVYYAESEYIEDIRSWLNLPNGKKSWRQYYQVGKRGGFYPTHCLSPIMNWFEGDHIDEISCFGVGPYNAPEYRQEDTSVTMCRLKSGKLFKLRIDVMSPRPNQISYLSLQGTKGAFELPRGPYGQQDFTKIYLSDGKPINSRGLRWQNIDEYQDYLPDAYKNMPKRAKELAKKGDYSCFGGDYFIVQDFIKACKGEIQVPITVYDACEWTAVALLGQISAENNGRPIKMPNFRGDRSDMQVRL